jgi:hypothetical protein
MMKRPAYFERIRERSSARWEQLEADAELAGPWHQLFKQVQSPRHVVSELLQNADDAGATEAEIGFDSDAFCFTHNGADFSEDNFASLCRFGYSNKRALHTIGFRGIGFKSTFSLGDYVELLTPTLSVVFDRARFSEPRWSEQGNNADRRTRVRVQHVEARRRQEVEKNLKEWVASPVSLLFFRNLRRIRVGDNELHWQSMGPGPVPNSEWMVLSDKPDSEHLLLRSEAEPFPEEALAEVRQERMLAGDDQTEFPPAAIDLIVGAKGRLYVVLPTGVETELPFACNAPFIQDPARLKIKDPEISPTNRWLLERAGRTAAKAMVAWVQQQRLSPADRAHAYSLFPDVDRKNSTLEGTAGTIVEEAFGEALDEAEFLLTTDGKLVAFGEAVDIPDEVLAIWPQGLASTLLDEKRRPALASEVSAGDRSKLNAWGATEEIDIDVLLSTLQTKHLPKPNTWRQLLALWSFLGSELLRFRYDVRPEKVGIFPVQGKDVLYAASEVVRLGEKKLLQSEADWDFLSTHLVVLNPNWPRFLADARREAEAGGYRPEQVEAAYAILQRLSLTESSDISKVVDQVAGAMFAASGLTVAACVQLAQIAAKLNASLGDRFRFATQDRHLRQPSGGILVDEKGDLAELLPQGAAEQRVLHTDYFKSFSSCSRDEWERWIASGNARLQTFLPLIARHQDVYGAGNIASEAARRGVQGGLTHPYKTGHFRVEDWDFPEDVWKHWRRLANDDETVWARVMDRILAQRDTYWTRARSARLVQVATTGATKSVTTESALPAWIVKFRSLACMRDTNGFVRKPAELLRRTSETEALLDVEPFIDRRFDSEANRSLLDLLGVRNTPTGPGRVLDMIRALSKAPKPPVQEVEKWYRRLDQLLDSCTTAEFQAVRTAFNDERLIFSHDNVWQTAEAVFIRSDEEDVPGAALVRASVSDLTLWRKVGVADRPTPELALAWLSGLPEGEALPADDIRRARSLLARFPERVWDECRHWLSLSGEWAPTDSLVYALTMQSLVKWTHLHPWVKQQTADFQKLSGEIAGKSPFADLPTLASAIEEKLHGASDIGRRASTKPWLEAFAADLRRIELEAAEETERVRALADRLAATRWRASSRVEITPYINGAPAGTPRAADVVWLDNDLYVESLPMAKLAKRVPEELGRAFGRADIKAALDYSFERSAEDVHAYMAGNFALAAAVNIPTPERADVQQPAEAVNEETLADHYDSSDDTLVESESGDNPAEVITDEPAPEAPADNEAEEAPPAPSPQPGPAKVRSTTPPKPALIERFAVANGFAKDGGERFFHSDGSWIQRSADGPFRWERRTGEGDLVCFYWDKDASLEAGPIELAAEIWGLIERLPDSHAVLLARTDGTPVEYRGPQLRQMAQAERIILYPASYRLVLSHDRQNDQETD